MKSVKALLFVMVFSLSVLAGCSSKPEEVPVDDTANTPVSEISVPATVPTTATVEGTPAEEDTGATTTTDAGSVATEEAAQ